PSDQRMGNLCPSSSQVNTVIFSPTNTSTIDNPYFSRWNLSTAPESRKYIERRPKMAKMLEVNTISGSRVSAKIAGTESTANTTSVASSTSSTTSSGVACR